MPVSDLATALYFASDDPRAWPAFCELLMRSTVLALITAPAGSFEPALLRLPRSDGAVEVPFFSTPKDVTLKREPGDHDELGLTLVAISMPELMARTHGCYLHMNPHSEISRDFSPAEIEELMQSGTLRSSGPNWASGAEAR
jgi:hypothetical protein